MSKKPQVGEWWRTRTSGIRYVAVDTEALGARVDNFYPIITIGENSNHTAHTKEGNFLVSGQHGYDLTEHLPDCTGWDWEPETFPQYWSTRSTHYAYLLRINAKRCCLVDKKGNQLTDQPWYDKTDRAGRTQLTKEEALERLDKPEPVESPDDWVIQNRVTARPGIDAGWWNSSIMTDVGTCDGWWNIRKDGSAIGKKHGYVASDGQILNLCCRRKDLPPITPPKPAMRTVTLNQWIVWDDTGEESEQWRADTPSDCWDNQYKTGESKTVEVPVDLD